MPRKAKRGATMKPTAKSARVRKRRTGSEHDEMPQAHEGAVRTLRNDERREATAIVLRIAAEHAAAFETIFESEEIPIWDDFIHRGRFVEASLVRVAGGSEQRDGIQDYILHVVAADHRAHEEHDADPRFRAFLAKAQELQPEEPLVWFGDILVERRG